MCPFVHSAIMHHKMSLQVPFLHYFVLLNSTRRYGPLRGPSSSSCGGLRPSADAVFLFALRAKRHSKVNIQGDFFFSPPPNLTKSQALYKFELALKFLKSQNLTWARDKVKLEGGKKKNHPVVCTINNKTKQIESRKGYPVHY